MNYDTKIVPAERKKWVVFISAKRRKTFCKQKKKQAFLIGHVQVVPPRFGPFGS
jgi:hypothetical protein